MRNQSITPGLYLLTAVCGIIDATSFLALGNVFSEVMTGNIMFLAFEIGQGKAVEALPIYTVPLVTFSIGAIGAGFLLRNPHLGGRRRHAFIAITILIAIAALLALLWDPQPRSGHAMIIVGVLAFAMGMQNAAVLFHAVPDVATNVMTLTLVRLLSNLSIVGGNNARWQYRVTSLAVFFLGAIIGAVLVRFGPAIGLWTATVLYLIALPLLLWGRPPQQPPNPAAHPAEDTEHS
jgi:uncharacterized membrane protein YoaK (UPF0700 family)